MTRRELIYRWIDALESGEYVQGKHMLAEKIRNDVRYCCLGVICEVGTKFGLIDSVFIRERDGSFQVVYDNKNLTLPPRLTISLGLRDDGGKLSEIGDRKSLTNFNDVNGFTFSQIAQIIRNNLENGNPDGLFMAGIDFDEIIVDEEVENSVLEEPELVMV